MDQIRNALDRLADSQRGLDAGRTLSFEQFLAQLRWRPDRLIRSVHQVLHDNYLENHEDLDTVEFYMCGPPMMNTAVQNLLDDMGVEKEMIDFDDFGG